MGTIVARWRREVEGTCKGASNGASAEYSFKRRELLCLGAVPWRQSDQRESRGPWSRGRGVRVRSARSACHPVSPGSSHMQSDIDAQLSNFFEETPPREFDTVLRGYDRAQVDGHIKQLDGEVRQHREQVQAMQRELSEPHRQIQEQELPTYSGLGARSEQLLRLAPEQATGLVHAARSEANEINAAAKVDPAEFPAAAENHSNDARANAKRA